MHITSHTVNYIFIQEIASTFFKGTVFIPKEF